MWCRSKLSTHIWKRFEIENISSTMKITSQAFVFIAFHLPSVFLCQHNKHYWLNYVRQLVCRELPITGLQILTWKQKVLFYSILLNLIYSSEYFIRLSLVMYSTCIHYTFHTVTTIFRLHTYVSILGPIHRLQWNNLQATSSTLYLSRVCVQRLHCLLCTNGIVSRLRDNSGLPSSLPVANTGENA